MSMYKICPACGAHNDPRSMECVECSCDLMGIPIIDSDNEVEQGETSTAESEGGNQVQIEPKEDSQPVQLVRICPCGEINPSQLRECRRCHEDISDILPTPMPQIVQYHYVLQQVDTGALFQVPQGVTIIGRENTMRELLSNKPFVSRIHAKLILEDEKLYIENLSTTNYTFVNNTKIPQGRVELKKGDEIGLGGNSVQGDRQKEAAYFMVGLMA